MLKLTTDKHEATRGLSATAELLVIAVIPKKQRHSLTTSDETVRKSLTEIFQNIVTVRSLKDEN